LATQLLPSEEPKLSPDVLGVFKECIEFASVRAANEFMILIRDFQIQHSRVQGLLLALGAPDSGEQVLWLNVESALAGCAELFVRGNDLFAYARFRKLRRNPISLPDIENALHGARYQGNIAEIGQYWQNIYSDSDSLMATFVEGRYEDDIV
jgi:hypothetical protein